MCTWKVTLVPCCSTGERVGAVWLIADGDAGTEGVPGWPGGGVDERFPDGLAGGVGKDGAGDVEDGVAAGDVGG